MGNILITCAGRRVSLVKAFKTELKLLLPNAKVFATDSEPILSAAAQVSEKAFKICKVEDDYYIESLFKICIENEISLVIPTIDSELIKLSENFDKFNSKGIQLVLSDEKIIKLCRSKIDTKKVFDYFKLKVPEFYPKYDYKLPLFIKPIDGSSSKNNFIILKEEEISVYHLYDNNLSFFQYIDKSIYDEYTCDLYYDKSSILKCIVPRKRIEIRAGEISKGVTKKNALVKFFNTQAIYFEGMKGCITIQCFMHQKNEEIIGIEINPRFGGGFPLSYKAGANFPKWIIQEYLLDKEITFYDDWQENLLMLRYDDEILVNDYKN